MCYFHTFHTAIHLLYPLFHRRCRCTTSGVFTPLFFTGVVPLSICFHVYTRFYGLCIRAHASLAADRWIPWLSPRCHKSPSEQGQHRGGRDSYIIFYKFWPKIFLPLAVIFRLDIVSRLFVTLILVTHITMSLVLLPYFYPLLIHPSPNANS